MKVQISQPYQYAHTLRVRFSCGIFCSTMTYVSGATDVVKGAREFAARLRHYKKDPRDYTGLGYPKGV